MRALLDLLAPVLCVGCGSSVGAELCVSCAERVRVLGGPRCDRCGEPQERDVRGCAGCADLVGFDQARSLVAFVEPARSLTLQLKRRGRVGLARDIGGLMAALVRRERLGHPDVVTYVPGGDVRHAGFDHARLLARSIASELGRGAQQLLRRVGQGPRQSEVPLARRRSNVEGRFCPVKAAPRSVLLVDDVFTTGSTADTCADALKGAGAEHVDVVTWARTERRRPRSGSGDAIYSSREPHPLGARGPAR